MNILDWRLILAAGLAIAGVVTYVAYLVGDARRGGGKTLRALSRSIPEALTRAKRARRNVVVAFVTPGQATSDRLIDALANDRSLDKAITRHFDLARIDAPADDREVVAHLAAKYGVGKLVVPSLLALDGDGQKVATLEDAAAFGEDDGAREKLVAFLEMARPGG